MSDLIDRQQAIDAIENAFDRETILNRFVRKIAISAVRLLPSALPKQRTGYWYPVGMAEAVGGESAQWGSAIAYHKCSECDEQALRDDFEQEVLSEWCPHCGVKMEGVSE